MQYSDDTVLVVGQARPNRDDAIFMTHGEFYISLVLDPAGTILDAECNTILSVTGDFVHGMLVGKNLTRDLPALEQMIRTRYFALTQKPLIACLKDAANRWDASRPARQG